MIVPITAKPSPVKRWPGEVDVPMYLHAADLLAWKASIDEAQRLTDEARAQGGTVSLEQATAINVAYQRGICTIVRGWRLQNLPESIVAENFPQTPTKAARELRGWLMREITSLFDDEETIPNA